MNDVAKITINNDKKIVLYVSYYVANMIFFTSIKINHNIQYILLYICQEIMNRYIVY